jgi:hypothetical protein
MRDLYHGTLHHHAHAIVGPPAAVDVTRGGGEFGRGFYVQTSPGNAKRWASGRSPKNAVVIKLKMDKEVYASLNPVVLNHQQARKLSIRLSKHNQCNTYVKACHVIVGPLNNNQRIEQFKFESAHSQNVLNGPNTTLTVLP